MSKYEVYSQDATGNGLVGNCTSLQKYWITKYTKLKSTL